jgi:hypothetical protein
MTTPDRDLLAALAEPFDPAEVDWKPQAVKDNRALAVAYVDARTVMDRLDKVLGIGNWQTAYRQLAAGVVCRLSARIAGEWVSHEDVGSFSDQPDEGDKLKAAFSDALKRAAIHFAVGRYLYSLPKQWCDYDPHKRQFVKTPSLPAWALPKRAINAEQRANLARLIEATGTDEEAFNHHFGCRGLAQLPATLYAKAVEQLERKRGQRKVKKEG